MSQTTGEEMLNRINATLGVLQDAQEKAVEAVRDVATHKADPDAHGEIIAAAVEAAVNEALGGTSGGGGGESGEDGGQLADRLAALESRFDESGKVLAANLPLSDAVNSATGTLAASDTAVKTAYDKAVAAGEAAAAATTTANNALEKANQAVATGGTLSLKGSRSTTGDWTLTEVSIGKPLFVIVDDPYATVRIKTVSGMIAQKNASYRFIIGQEQTFGSTNVLIVVPTDSTVVLNVTSITSGQTLRAYQ